MIRFLVPILAIIGAAGAAPAGAEPPARVAIAGGVATEIAYLLGAEAAIVGVDRTSRYPAAAQTKPQLGYFRRLSSEGVLALRPDVLIASPYAGPPGALDQLRSAGVTVAVAPDVVRMGELPAKARFVGAALGRPEAGAALAARLEGEIAALEASAGTNGPRMLFVLTIQNGAPLVAGDGTPPDEVIRLAGARNVAGFSGFKPMSREAILAAAPDLVLMTEEHSALLGGPAAMLAKPELAATPAGVAGRAVALPALAVLGLGPRTPAVIRDLRAAF